MRSRWSSRTKQLSYAELNRRANQLAHYLTRAGRQARRPRGHLPGARPGDDRGPAGRAQGRRRLRAARSGLSARTAALHARRHRAGGAAHAEPSAGAVHRNSTTALPVLDLDAAAAPWQQPAGDQPRSGRHRPQLPATSPTSSTPPAPPDSPKASWSNIENCANYLLRLDAWLHLRATMSWTAFPSYQPLICCVLGDLMATVLWRRCIGYCQSTYCGHRTILYSARLPEYGDHSAIRRLRFRQLIAAQATVQNRIQLRHADLLVEKRSSRHADAMVRPKQWHVS